MNRSVLALCAGAALALTGCWIEERGSPSASASAAQADAYASGEQQPPDDGLRPIPPINTSRQLWTAQPPREAGPASGGELEPGRAGSERGEWVIDDFEGEMLWVPIAWGNANECSISLVETGRGKALAMECARGDSDKAGVILWLHPGADATGFDHLTLDIKLEDGKDVAVAVALQTGVYFELPPRRLEAGWNRALAFSLKARDYKTAPRWEHSSALRGMSHVKSLLLVVYCKGACRLLVDDVRLVQGPH